MPFDPNLLVMTSLAPTDQVLGADYKKFTLSGSGNLSIVFATGFTDGKDCFFDGVFRFTNIGPPYDAWMPLSYPFWTLGGPQLTLDAGWTDKLGGDFALTGPYYNMDAGTEVEVRVVFWANPDFGESLNAINYAPLQWYSGYNYNKIYRDIAYNGVDNPRISLGSFGRQNITSSFTLPYVPLARAWIRRYGSNGSILNGLTQPSYSGRIGAGMDIDLSQSGLFAELVNDTPNSYQYDAYIRIYEDNQ